MIIAKVGKEAAEEKVNNLQSEITLLNSQIAHDQHHRKVVEESVDIEIKQLRYIIKYNLYYWISTYFGLSTNSVFSIIFRKHIAKLEKEKKQYLAKNAEVIEKEERISELENTLVSTIGSIIFIYI